MVESIQRRWACSDKRPICCVSCPFVLKNLLTLKRNMLCRVFSLTWEWRVPCLFLVWRNFFTDVRNKVDWICERTGQWKQTSAKAWNVKIFGKTFFANVLNLTYVLVFRCVSHWSNDNCRRLSDTVYKHTKWWRWSIPVLTVASYCWIRI